MPKVAKGTGKGSCMKFLKSMVIGGVMTGTGMNMILVFIKFLVGSNGMSMDGMPMRVGMMVQKLGSREPKLSLTMRRKLRRQLAAWYSARCCVWKRKRA